MPNDDQTGTASRPTAADGRTAGDSVDNAASPNALRQKLLRPQTLLSFGLALAIVVFLVTRLDINLGEVWSNVRHINPFAYAIAYLVYYFAFFLRTVRWKGMLAQAGIDAEHGHPIPAYPRLMATLLLSWFVNCIVPAKLGDGYRCYLLRKDTGASFSSTLGTILAERLTDLLVLFFMMTGAGLFAFHGSLPSEVTQTLAVGLVLITVGLGVVAAMGLAKSRVERLVPLRFKGQFALLHDAIFACLRRPGRPIGIGIAVWLLDGVRLYLVAWSLGAGLSFSVTLFVALMSALLSALPFTPAGLGVVEAAVIVVLKLVDVNSSLAGSIAIMDRLIGFWSLIVIGLFLYLRRLKGDVGVPRSALAN